MQYKVNIDSNTHQRILNIKTRIREVVADTNRYMRSLAEMYGADKVTGQYLRRTDVFFGGVAYVEFKGLAPNGWQAHKDHKTYHRPVPSTATGEIRAESQFSVKVISFKAINDIFNFTKFESGDKRAHCPGVKLSRIPFRISIPSFVEGFVPGEDLAEISEMEYNLK